MAHSGIGYTGDNSNRKDQLIQSKEVILLRKRVFFLLLAGFLMNGCIQDAGHSPDRLVLNETVVYPDNEPPSIKIKGGEGKWEEISSIDDYPSQPAINPDQTKLAFISPYAFEMAGEVWLYDAASAKKEKRFTLEQAGNEQTARTVIWFDNDHLIVLTGNTFGTISSNRTLYLLNIQDRQLQKLYEAEPNQDIPNPTLSDGTSVSFQLATYKENGTDFTATNKIVKVTDFLSTK
jgi:hypothetical protein